jgi:hypothetical protein
MRGRCEVDGRSRKPAIVVVVLRTELDKDGLREEDSG